MVTNANQYMQIGELAKKAGLSQRTIHYYEELGLIKPMERKGVGYRYYDEVTLTRLNKIAVLKNAGLSLKEVASVIDLYFEDPTGLKGKRKVLEILRQHLAVTESKMSKLQSFKRETLEVIERLEKIIRETQKGAL